MVHLVDPPISLLHGCSPILSKAQFQYSSYLNGKPNRSQPYDTTAILVNAPNFGASLFNGEIGNEEAEAAGSALVW